MDWGFIAGLCSSVPSFSCSLRDDGFSVEGGTGTVCVILG